MEMKAFLRANWDRVAACALIVLGALALVLGWLGVSRTGLAAEQNPYLISGGLAGIALVAIGCTMWLSSDLQDEWRRLDALEERLGQLGEQADPTETTEAAPDGDGPATTRPNGRRPRTRKTDDAGVA
jgi:hypothetical protein